MRYPAKTLCEINLGISFWCRCFEICWHRNSHHLHLALFLGFMQQRHNSKWESVHSLNLMVSAEDWDSQRKGFVAICSGHIHPSWTCERTIWAFNLLRIIWANFPFPKILKHLIENSLSGNKTQTGVPAMSSVQNRHSWIPILSVCSLSKARAYRSILTLIAPLYATVQTRQKALLWHEMKRFAFTCSYAVHFFFRLQSSC